MRRTASALGLAAVLVGVPILLLALSGPPELPSYRGVSLTDSYLPSEVVLDTLAFVAWMIYGYVAFASALRLLALALSAADTRSSRALVAVSAALAPSPLRRLIDVAVGGALLAATLSPPHIAANAPPSRPPVTAAELKPDAATSNPRPDRAPTYRVRPGDSLWRIAERKLGSGFR